jgi:hypothetical protein
MVNWPWSKNEKKEEEEVNDDELQKKGFNPESLDVSEIGEKQFVTNFDKYYEGCISPSP